MTKTAGKVLVRKLRENETAQKTRYLPPYI
jgi:hypothetical protein